MLTITVYQITAETSTRTVLIPRTTVRPSEPQPFEPISYPACGCPRHRGEQ